ncbi:MAG: bifunctional demethylmenaquinone methyltransferase/2-methoxy-6-polyprenyl-1,4-benzoquinol methylase UbiE [Methyloceanibacter sp.]|jgi:demethylmenaquinone methyltransferase/2-methoxy-6-polyprenyl-1,4-benzoquinol methylase
MPDDIKNRDKSGVETSFGFARVSEGARQGLVNEVFSRVASRYDLMNDLMSGGLHRLWKTDLVTALAPPKTDTDFALIDVAGGTGDIATRFLDIAGGGSSAVICDISKEMMNEGVKRAAGRGRLSFVQGNAESLPFQSGRFHAYSIAFGIRNVTHIETALAEAYRVLKPGGRFLCLEFSNVEMPVLDRLYDAYSFNAIPALGRLVAGDAESYRYLVESIRRFPDQDRFAGMIQEAGFERVRYRNLTGGIAAIHSGWRL